MKGDVRTIVPSDQMAADLIATTGNPLEDIHALDRVEFVMKDGRVVRQPR